MSGGGCGKSTTIGGLTSGKLLGCECESCWPLSVVPVNGEEVWGKYIWTKGKVGEDRGSKQTDGCPLTVIEFACGLRSMAECPSCARRMQFPARLRVTLAMCMSSLANMSVLLTFVNICMLSLHSLVGGGELNMIINLLGWCCARGFWGFGCFLEMVCVVCEEGLWCWGMMIL
jgi:hypothetical protein